MSYGTKVLYCSRCNRLETHNKFKQISNNTVKEDINSDNGVFYFVCSICDTKSNYSEYCPKITLCKLE